MISHHAVQVRWPDLDSFGHVNHTAVLTYLEVGRDAVLRSCGVSPAEYVVRHCEVDYLRELQPTDPSVDYVCNGFETGRTSVRTSEQLIDARGNVAVEARFALVMWDPVARSARALTRHEKDRLTPKKEIRR